MNRKVIETVRDASGVLRPQRYRLNNPATNGNAAATIKAGGVPPRTVRQKNNTKPPTSTGISLTQNPAREAPSLRLAEAILRTARTPKIRGTRNTSRTVGGMSSARIGVMVIKCAMPDD